MTVRTSAGTTLHVCASAPATYNTAGYAALTWVAVGELVDAGDFGREYTLVTHNPLANRTTQKFKGSFNEGKLAAKLGLDTDDAGQILMKAASLSDSAYSFKVTTQNTDKYYFPGMVMSWKVGVGGVNKITEAMADIELTTSPGVAAVGVVEDLAP
jgi:hypothetical protein